MSPARAIANVGAEEDAPLRESAERARAPVIALFRDQIERAEPVFGWLPRDEVCVAWLNTQPSLAEARSLGRPLFGASPEVTRRCHDKAFAWRVAREQALEPAPLRDRIECLSPERLGDPAAVLERIAHQLEHAGDRGLTLKPRLGTSGRGRVPVRGTEDLERVRRELPRLARAGGVLVEPWLQRTQDLSVVLYVAPSAELTLVASAELLVTQSGGYRGHRGWIDARGRVTSGSRHDEPMREAAASVAAAAAREGYTGPCGIDGLVFEAEGRAWLRPVVELNARFTTGTLLAACVRERLPELRAVGLRPDAPLAFRFDLSARVPRVPAGSRVSCHALSPASSPADAVPVLTVAPTPEEIDEVLGAAS